MRSLIRLLSLTTIIGVIPAAAAPTEEEHSNIAAHERVADSVVLVLVRSVEADGGVPGTGSFVTGSGFAVEPGLIVTNYHVVASAAAVEVVIRGGDSARAEIVATAPGFDLALLKVPFDAEVLPPAPLATSLDLKVGQRVLACSHPLGLQHSMSLGIVSGLDRELPGFELGPSVIQFDAPLNPGQSGGPLVDSEGRVVGVTTAKIMGAEAIGFAIPVDIVVRILPDMKSMGHVFRPQLGMSGVSVDPDLARMFGLPSPRGFLIENVDRGGAADTAGIRAGRRHVMLREHEFILGGDIIVAVNGVPVSGGSDLGLRFLATRSGETLSLSVVGPSGVRTLDLVIPPMRH